MQQSPISLFETLAKEFDEVIFVCLSVKKSIKNYLIIFFYFQISVTKEEIGFNLIALEASAYNVYEKDYVIENTGTDNADLLKEFSKLTTNEKPVLS